MSRKSSCVCPDDVINYLDKCINDDSLVGVGDSVTFEEIGIYEYLRDRKIEFLDKHDLKLSKIEKKELYLKNFTTDFFLSSANAICSEGKIYNLDGNGSRVAPIIYGPKKVFIVCGVSDMLPH